MGTLKTVVWVEALGDAMRLWAGYMGTVGDVRRVLGVRLTLGEGEGLEFGSVKGRYIGRLLYPFELLQVSGSRSCSADITNNPIANLDSITI
jgi:hypothetical protein